MDVSGGRKLDDRANNASGKSYNNMAYAFLQGNSKYVVLYDVREGEDVMVKSSRSQRTFRSMGLSSFCIVGGLTMLELMWASPITEMEVTWRKVGRESSWS